MFPESLPGSLTVDEDEAAPKFVTPERAPPIMRVS